jgi:peptidoglycan hydrolase-like protein with peptidoglycan-binding domain
MNTKTQRLPLLTLLLLAAACGAENPTQPEPAEVGSATPLSERLNKLNQDLSVGSQGEEARAVNDYLRAFGYFPDEELAQMYAGWRPIIAEAPARADVFDAHTEHGVMALQANAGLPVTGLVDVETRALLRRGRCGVPDGIMTRHQSSHSATNELASNESAPNEFALIGDKWPSGNLTWKLTNTNDVTQQTADAAVASAFAQWSARAGQLTFTKVASNQTADIVLEFTNYDGVGGVLAYATSPSKGGDVTIDAHDAWTWQNPVPANTYDLETVVAHEIGHALGLHHSSFGSGAALMGPFIASASKKQLVDDDKVAISVLYDAMSGPLSPTASDIGAGANGAVWYIGTDPVGSNGDFGIYHLGAGQADGGAVRISVGGGAIPWIVNAAGQIFRRTTHTHDTGHWEQLDGLAKDIGASWGTSLGGAAWVIGTNQIPGTNDFGIYKWTGTTWEASDGGAVRIAVGRDLRPWVVNSSGQIFRRTTSSATSGTWEQMPGGATDIAAGDYVWILGGILKPGGYDAYVWNEQPQLMHPNIPGQVVAPARAEWLLAGTRGGQIASGSQGWPWIIGVDGSIWRPTK